MKLLNLKEASDKILSESIKEGDQIIKRYFDGDINRSRWALWLLALCAYSIIFMIAIEAHQIFYVLNAVIIVCVVYNYCAKSKKSIIDFDNEIENSHKLLKKNLNTLYSNNEL
jgi:Flp pilus assembly protein TadB